MQKFTVPIKGMHCKSCELTIEENLKQIPSIKKCSVSHASKKAKIWYEGVKPSVNQISTAVENAGYTVGQEDKKHWFSRNERDYFNLLLSITILLGLYIVAKMFGLSEISNNFTGKSIAAAGLIGLVAGVSSCMALIGGLVLALSARHAEQQPMATRMQKFRPHLFFNLGRIFGFTLLGGMIGLIGGAIQPSIRTMSILTIVVGAVMILLGLKLIEIFPILQRVNITMPKFVSKLLGIKQEAKEYSHRSAFVGGILTFFLPCGFTQAMQLYAISTGSFIQGALIMSLFALGTAPGLLGIGGLASSFKGAKAKLFFSTAGAAVILLGIFNISNASRIVFPANAAIVSSEAKSSGDTQTITTTYKSGVDILPKEFTVKAGQPVKFLVDVKDEGFGCMSTIMIPGLYNQPLFLKKDTQLALEFTPGKKGSYPITCAMGVKRGTLIVD